MEPKNGKEISYRILYYREMGTKVLKVTIDDMKDWFVNIMVLGTNLQISRLLRQKIIVNCRINLKT